MKYQTSATGEHGLQQQRPRFLNGVAKLSDAVGAVLILVGIFVPPSTLIASLREPPVDPLIQFLGKPLVNLHEQLLLGATILKIGLLILGIVVITLGRMPIWKSDIQPAKPSSEPNRLFILVILGIILSAASVLRLYDLNSGLWWDEIFTYIKYANMPFGEIISTYDSENQHFLNSLLTHASFLIFGESAWALRLPAFVFGIGSIWALYLLGRQVGSTREALLAAALLAFSYHHIWYSQNARGYTGMLFWTLLSSWLLIRSLHEARPQLWPLYATTAALGVYAHLTMLVVISAHFIIYIATLLTRRKESWPGRWTGLFFGFCLAGFLILFIHALVLPQLLRYFVNINSLVPIWKNPLWTLLEFARGIEVNFAGSSIIAGTAFLVFGAGLWSFARTTPAIVQLLVIPSLICAMGVIWMGHHLWPRFFFFLFGFGALVLIRGVMLLGDGMARLLRVPSEKASLLGTALGVGLILLSAISVPMAYGPKQDYQGALNFVETRKEPGDAIVTIGVAAIPYTYFYKTDWKVADTLETLNTIGSHAKRTWVIYTLPLPMQSNPEQAQVLSVVERDFQVIKLFPGTLHGGTIFVCRADVPPSSPSLTGDKPASGEVFNR